MALGFVAIFLCDHRRTRGKACQQQGQECRFHSAEHCHVTQAKGSRWGVRLTSLVAVCFCDVLFDHRSFLHLMTRPFTAQYGRRRPLGVAGGIIVITTSSTVMGRCVGWSSTSVAEDFSHDSFNPVDKFKKSNNERVRFPALSVEILPAKELGFVDDTMATIGR